jgi:Domain of unknown function (DUF4136)
MRSTQTTMIITFIILSLVVGSLAQEIKTDYDRNADFSHYKTFSFEKVETKDPLWVERITVAVGRELTAKGWTQVASGGDIAIIAIRMTTDEQTLDSVYNTHPGGWGWRWGSGYGDATTTPGDLYSRYTRN